MSKFFTIPTKIVDMEETKFFPDGKYKLAFDCESPNGTPRKCIHWGIGLPQGIEIGDEVILTGHIKNGVFLAIKLKYRKQKKEEQSG